MSLSIDVFVDVVCPWCWIGERRLARALELWRARHPQVAEPTVRFLPFELNPDLPAEGIDRRSYLESKFGPGAGADMYARVLEAGKDLGLAFDFAAIRRQPNTRAAHVLLHGAIGQPLLQHAMLRAFMRAFFTQGADLGTADVLVHTAAQAGLPEAAGRAWLADPELKARTTAIEMQARTLGISGVPFFIIDRRLEVSGAQPPEELLAALEEASGRQER